MYTELEAKTKWCPYALLPGEEPGVSYNRDHLEATDYKMQHGTNCIASDCMMWKSDGKQIVGEFMPEHGGKPENRKGYCGLTK